MQVPLYPPAFFQNEADGEGINIVMYFKINESFLKEVPSSFQEAIRVRYVIIKLVLTSIFIDLFIYFGKILNVIQSLLLYAENDA